MRNIDGREVLLRLQNFRGEPVRLAQAELRIDHDHVLLARNHRRVHIVAVDPVARVNLELKMRLRERAAREQTGPQRGDCKKAVYSH